MYLIWITTNMGTIDFLGLFKTEQEAQKVLDASSNRRNMHISWIENFGNADGYLI